MLTIAVQRRWGPRWHTWWKLTQSGRERCSGRSLLAGSHERLGHRRCLGGHLPPPSYGPLQAYLADLGFHYSGNLLGNPTTAIFACIGVNVWEFTGFSMFLYMVALHRIPSELLDAAVVDGATGWRLTRRQVLAPLLSPTTRSLVLLGIVGTLQTFPLVYLLTDGGPNNASQIFGTYIFTKAFVENELGYGSALSVVVLAIAMIATAVQLRVFKSPAGLGVEGQ